MNFQIATFDGTFEIERGSGMALEIGGRMATALDSGAELLVVSTTESVADLLNCVGDAAYSALLDLSVWQRWLAIPDRLDGLTINDVGNGLGTVFMALLDVDPSVLAQSQRLYGLGRIGESRLLDLALATQQHSGLLAGGGPPELTFLKHRERPERLKRKKGAEGVDPDSIAGAFAPAGALASGYAAWETREQQQRMAQEVAYRLRDGGELIAEAGTGTGKSLAYLLPAMTHAALTGEQVVVATNTRVLQDQLATREAPVAAAAITAMNDELRPRFNVLKGRGNYLCLRRWFGESQPLAADIDESRQLARLNLWVSRTESGDRAELPLTPAENRVFNRVSAEGEACDASRCLFQLRNQCFLYRARRSAESAHVVITNHALLMTDVAQGGEALPEARHLIIDEAHHLEDQATASFQTTISIRLINAFLNEITGDPRRPQFSLITDVQAILRARTVGSISPGEQGKLNKTINEIRTAGEQARIHAATLFALLAAETQASSDRSREYGVRIRITDGVRHSPGWQSIEREWDSTALSLAWIRSGLTGLQELVENLADPSASDEGNGNAAAILQLEDLANRTGTVGRKVGEAIYLLNAAIHNPLPDQVFWIESRSDGRETSVNSAPLQLAEYLQRHLFGRLDSLILTSATMSAGASFSFVKQRLGLPDADELRFTSPFDFQTNALLVVPADLPEPNEAGFAMASHRAVLDTALAARGRTLVLFTSIQAMNAARAALADQFRNAGLALVTQHEDGTAEQLAERLRTFDETVVFGAGAFWEGVDIPGPALSALVIAKLPFAVPSDPIVAARSETFDSPFMEYSVPQAILRFRQGFGRLIRSQSDRGVCVALDRRLISKRYGSLILNALPNAQRQFPELAELGQIVSDFLADGSESG